MTSLDAYAVSIEAAVAADWPATDLVRLLAQAVDDFGRLADDEAQVAFLAEPRMTGDATWDAALAAVAVHLCRQAGWSTTPDWTRDAGRYAPDFRWIGLPSDSTMRAYVFQRTPAYFQARGIMLDEANLVSV